MFKVLSLSLDTGRQSFLPPFIALSMIRSQSAQTFTVWGVWGLDCCYGTHAAI